MNITLFPPPSESVTKRIEETLILDPKWNHFVLRNQDYARSISTVAFQHFINCSTETVAHPAIRDVMKTDMIRVSFSVSRPGGSYHCLVSFLTVNFKNSHLMYTVLGVGMMHLNRMSPTKERTFAESLFWQHAIQKYQEALFMPVRKDSVDGLLSTCMLMGSMTVCPERFVPTDSWVLTKRPKDLNWLCLQSGLRLILSLTAPYLPGSIWAAAFNEVSKEECQLHDQRTQQGRVGLDPDLADVCEIDNSTTERNSLYYAPLRTLTTLMGLEKNSRNSALCASFMGRSECSFLTLLKARDPPALIILAHWMGLMCLLSQWQPWVEGRIRAECVAICMFLEQSADSRMRRLLRFPAGSCGYGLDKI